jgi:Family of unknown function (DUF6188)
VNDHVVEEVNAKFILPIAGFVCGETRSGPGADRHELILRSADSTDEAWVTGSHIGGDLIRQLVGDEARVEKAAAAHDSTLRIDFDDGISVVNPPAEKFVGWEVRGPGYVLILATPGGGEPAVWDATSEIRTIRPGEPLPPRLVEAIDVFGLPMPAGEFQLRCSKGRRRSFELHPPNAPELNRSEIVQFI